MNDVELRVFGHLGKDPEMHYLPSGKAVTNFSVAASRKWKDKDGNEVSETTWVRVSAFDKVAEMCAEYLHKGSHVYVEGRLNVDAKTGGPRIWTRQDDQSVGANFEITLQNIKFLTPKSGTGNGDTPAEDESSQALSSEPVGATAGANTDSDGFPL
jgi:single-strand DNA-binding protein